MSFSYATCAKVKAPTNPAVTFSWCWLDLDQILGVIKDASPSSVVTCGKSKYPLSSCRVLWRIFSHRTFRFITPPPKTLASTLVIRISVTHKDAMALAAWSQIGSWSDNCWSHSHSSAFRMYDSSFPLDKDGLAIFQRSDKATLLAIPSTVFLPWNGDRSFPQLYPWNESTGNKGMIGTCPPSGCIIPWTGFECITNPTPIPVPTVI